MYAQDNILCQFGPKICPSVQQLISQPILIHFWWELYQDVYRFLNIHTKRIIMSRDVRWLNIIWKHYRMKSIYARKQVELFLDEEERSVEDEKSFEESSIEEEEKT